MRPSSAVLLFLVVLAAGCASTPRPALVAENAALAGDGVSIRYRLAGRDNPEPTIVLVHGFGGDSTFWDAQIAHLSRARRVVALDLPGHGKSGSDRMGEWSMEAFGDDVRSVCDEVGARSVVLVGHSMGGPVAVEAARLMPERVVGLVLVETFHEIDQKMDQAQLDQFLGAMRADYQTVVEQTTRQFFFTPDADPQVVETVVAHMRALDPAVAVALLDDMFHYDADQRIEGVSVPVRLINSNAMQPTDVDALKSHVRDFALVTMTKVGHFPMLEAPEKLNELLDASIRDVIAAGKKSPPQ